MTHLPEVEAELRQAPFDALLVAVEAAVAQQDRVQPAVGGVPVALRVVPARLFGDADRGEGDGDDVDVPGPDAGEREAELRRLVRHAVLGVLVADEALLLGGGDEPAVDVEGGGGVVGERAGKAEDGEGQGRASG